MSNESIVGSFWKHQVTKHISKLSLDGISTETLALSAALGLVLGIFPVYGIPTLLCAAAVILPRVNLPAVQLVNLLTSPLQLALLVPLGRLGERLLHPHAVIGPHPFSAKFTFDIGRLAAGALTGSMHAVVGWLCICLPLGIFSYLMLNYTLQRFWRPKNREILLTL
jgi:uncharacterized protein (DUF2062 family)